MQGWIKLYRKLADWEWYSDPITKAVFIDLLIYAARQPTKWRGQTVEAGTCITSLDSISSRNGISVSQTRTALSHLQKTGEIDKQSTNKNTVIIVLNFKRYQELMCDEENHKSQSNDNQIAIKSQSNDNQIATYKNIENIENVENIEKEISKSCCRSSDAHAELSGYDTKELCGSNVWLSPHEQELLAEAIGDTLTTEQYIEKLDEFLANTPHNKCRNHYKTILKWAKEDGYDNI